MKKNRNKSKSYKKMPINSRIIFDDFDVSQHALERFRERVMLTRNLNISENKEKTVEKIKRELDGRNIKKVINFGDKYKYIFTKRNTEFRFIRSHSNNFWILTTVVDYPKMLLSEEPLSIEEINGSIKFGITTAIKIREKQKLEYEMELNNERK